MLTPNLGCCDGRQGRYRAGDALAAERYLVDEQGRLTARGGQGKDVSSKQATQVASGDRVDGACVLDKRAIHPGRCVAHLLIHGHLKRHAVPLPLAHAENRLSIQEVVHARHCGQTGDMPWVIVNGELLSEVTTCWVQLEQH